MWDSSHQPRWRRLAPTSLALSAMLAAWTGARAEAQGHAFGIAVSMTPDADFGPGRTLSARAHRHEWRAPPRRLGAAMVTAGARYGYTRFEYSGIPSRNRDLHLLQVPLTAEGGAGRWRWRVHAAPGVATSSNVMKDLFKRGSSADLFATGEVLASWDHGVGTLAFGIAHDRRFGRSLSYPKFAWRGGTDRFEWQLGAPDAWLEYRPREGTTLTLGAGPAGMQWHTVRDDFESDFDYRVRRWDLRLELRQRIFGRVSLALHAGRGFDRRHRFETDTFVPLDLDAEDAVFFGVGLIFGTGRRADGYAEAW